MFTPLSHPKFGRNYDPNQSENREARTPQRPQRQNAMRDLFAPANDAFTPTTPANSIELSPPGAPPRPQRQRTQAEAIDLSSLRRRLFEEAEPQPNDTQDSEPEQDALESLDSNGEEKTFIQSRRPDSPGR